MTQLISSTQSLQHQNQPLLHTSNDEEIIELYLNQVNDQGHPRYSKRTQESYYRDIKRLRIFLDDQTLANIKLETVYAFIEWLKNPPAYLIDQTCRRSTQHPEWRPFYKNGLSASALKQQLASLKAFYRWLSDIGYLKSNRNPFSYLKSAKSTNTLQPKRQLYKEDLLAVAHYLLNTLPTLPAGRLQQKLLRQRWLWHAYLLSGLRISELIQHNTGHIYSEVVSSNKIWMIAVTGKGRHEPEPHPLPDAFMEELWHYRDALQLDPWPNTPEPLVLSLNGKKAMSSRSSAHNEFKDLIHQVSDHQQQAGHYDSANRLANASTHWLRHSFVTSLLDISSDIPAVSNLARHRDIKTTLGYDHSELQTLKDILNNFAQTVTQ